MGLKHLSDFQKKKLCMVGFEELMLKLKQEFKLPLPGVEAQYKLAPTFRGKLSVDNEIPADARKAGVLILIYPIDDKPHLVVTRRNAYASVHSSQISFPGGKYETDLDYDLVHTALRETHEEIGVAPTDVELIGNLTHVYIPPSNFYVWPSVAITSAQPLFKPDPKEVLDIIEISLVDLLDPSFISQVEVDVKGLNRSVPCFNFYGNIVWGATAIMLSEFTTVLERALNQRV